MRVVKIALSLLVAYYLFVSGFVFEVIGSEQTGRLDTPYSIAMSNYRMNLIATYDSDDTACLKWLAQNAFKDRDKFQPMPILMDYNSATKMFDITVSHYLIFEQVKYRHYVFLSTYNIENNCIVVGEHAGVRNYEPLPEIWRGSQLVYQSGKAKVYFCHDQPEVIGIL